MEQVTLTEEPIYTEEQFRLFYRAQYLKRKHDDIEKYKEQKKRYNAKAYAKRSDELKQLAYARKMAKQRQLKEETPTI
jgi:hypothetical protein